VAFTVIQEQAVAAGVEVKAFSRRMKLLSSLRLQHHHVYFFASSSLVHPGSMSSKASQLQARPLWAVNSIITQVPDIRIADPFDDVPRPPLPPSDDAIIQDTIKIGTMFGTEKDQIDLFFKVNTVVNLYARRLPNSTEVWVLCHFTQTTERDSTYTLFSYAAGAPSAVGMQQF
jgi:hypothetical protein